MNCLRCNTDNDETARFCRSCGVSLAVYTPMPQAPVSHTPIAHTPVARDEGLRDNLVYLLILMGWEYFTYIMWFVVRKITILIHDGSQISPIYKMVGLVTDSVSLLLLILFAVLSRNTTVRIWLIVFAFLRLIFLVIYRVM